MNLTSPDEDPLLPTSQTAPSSNSHMPQLPLHTYQNVAPANNDARGSDGNEIWDQLDDHEAMEVRQHQSRFSQPQAFESRSNPLVVLGSMVGTSLQHAADQTYQNAALLRQHLNDANRPAIYQPPMWSPDGAQDIERGQQQPQQQQQVAVPHGYGYNQAHAHTSGQGHATSSTYTHSRNGARSYFNTATNNNGGKVQRYAPLPVMDENDVNLGTSHGSIPLDATLLQSTTASPHHSHHPQFPQHSQNSHHAQYQQQKRQENGRPHGQQGNSEGFESIYGVQSIAKSVFLKVASFPNRAQHDGWGAVPNVDLFLSHLYTYYYNRGLVPILCKGMVEIITMCITLGLSAVLLGHVDWQQVWQCQDEETCHAHVQDYLVWSSSDTATSTATHSFMYKVWKNFVIPTYIVVFGTYTIFTAWQFWQQVQHAIMAKNVLEDKLGFASRKLLGGSIAWEDIVKQLVHVQEAGTFRFMINYGNGNGGSNASSNASSLSQSPSSSLTKPARFERTPQRASQHPQHQSSNPVHGTAQSHMGQTTGTSSPSASQSPGNSFGTECSTDSNSSNEQLNIRSTVSVMQGNHATLPMTPEQRQSPSDELGNTAGDNGQTSPPSAMATSVLDAHEQKQDSTARSSSPHLPTQIPTQMQVEAGEQLQQVSQSTSGLSILEVAQRIMRKDNFLVALWNQGDRLLDCTVGGRMYFGATLEWSLHFCITNFMFNHKYQVRPAFVQDPVALEQRFRLVGYLHIIFMPFVLVFQIMHFALQNVYEFQRSNTYFGGKDWSRAAKWTFREFNELPHVFDARMEPSYKAADEYFGLFGSSEVLLALGHLLVFVGGATGGVLLILAAMNDALLLHVQYGGRNLVWYAGIAGIVYSVGKSLSPTNKPRMVSHNLYKDMDTALLGVAEHTHFYPDIWKNRGWESSVHGALSKLMDSKVKLLLYELASVVLAPYILICKWAPAADKICNFCQSTRHRLRGPGAGDVCGYSTFDFNLYGDEAWDGCTMCDRATPQKGNARRNATRSKPTDLEKSTLGDTILNEPNHRSSWTNRNLAPPSGTPKARHGKMEKSLLNFRAANPGWECRNPGGQSMLLRLEQQQHAAALAEERQMHIDAAKRQLRTLDMLEQQQQQQFSA